MPSALQNPLAPLVLNGLFGIFGIFCLFLEFLPFSIFYRAITKNISESTCGKSNVGSDKKAQEILLTKQREIQDF